MSIATVIVHSFVAEFLRLEGPVGWLPWATIGVMECVGALEMMVKKMHFSVIFESNDDDNPTFNVYTNISNLEFSINLEVTFTYPEVNHLASLSIMQNQCGNIIFETRERS